MTAPTFFDCVRDSLKVIFPEYISLSFLGLYGPSSVGYLKPIVLINGESSIVEPAVKIFSFIAGP